MGIYEEVTNSLANMESVLDREPLGIKLISFSAAIFGLPSVLRWLQRLRGSDPTAELELSTAVGTKNPQFTARDNPSGFAQFKFRETWPVQSENSQTTCSWLRLESEFLTSKSMKLQETSGPK